MRAHNASLRCNRAARRAAGGGNGSAPSSQTLPVQDDQAAPDRDGDGKPCPEDEGGGSGSGESAPQGSATPSTEL